MNRNKALASALAVLLFAAGCASGGPKKPTIYAEKQNNIPADIPSQFLLRYERFVSGKESKEFKKLKTDEERQAFIDKFWAERDSDPATPENEEKERIDKLIDDIASERFFSGTGISGLLFRSNGGFRGDMAHVYMFYGEPDAMDMIDGSRFVDLMLWVYVDERDGDVLYAFLFYQKGTMGAFQLFSQDAYKLDPCGAINEIRTLGQFSGRMGECAPDTEDIFRELYSATGKAGVLDGYIFAWALFNFSQDGSITQGAALDAPKPAAEVARRSRTRVAGEAPERVGTAGTDFILASCKECKSFIPAELRLGERFTITGPAKNFDWVVRGEDLELSFKHRVVLQNRSGDKPIVVEGLTKHGRKKSSVDPEALLTLDILDPALVLAIPPGTYRVSVYIKNPLTGKYNAWVIDQFVK